MQNAYIAATAGVAGSFSEMFTAIGGESEKWQRASKIAAAAMALINSLQGASLALAQGGIFGFAASAAILAKGLALVAAIKGTPILGMAQGGAFKVPGIGSNRLVPVQFMATPGERVTVETPQQQVRSGGSTKIVVRGKLFGRDTIEEIIEGINSAIGDNYKLRIA